MSKILPFRALRPKKEFVKDVASLPYDVYDLEEAKKIVQNNPLSFLRVEKSEIDLPATSELYTEHTYEIAKKNLENLLRQGVMFQDEKPCFYIYRQKSKHNEQYGITAVVSIEEYESDRIKKHELTRTDKEIDRIKHVARVGANTGPVFITYLARQEIDTIVQHIVKRNPEYDFISDDGIEHTVWIVSDYEEIESLISAFSLVDNLYIADGHHRAAAATAVRKMKKEQNQNHTGKEAYNFMLSVLFPHNQLKILPYNRAVRDLNGMSIVEFLDRVGEKFNISDALVDSKPPQIAHEIKMYLKGRWYKLTLKDENILTDDPLKLLDVSILQDDLLDRVLSIQDPRTDNRIAFIGGVKGEDELENLVNSGSYDVAFSLYPTTVSEMIKIVEAGRIMPPKSTWFEPKLRSGIFIHLIT